jgi:hypothetical protein
MEFLFVVIINAIYIKRQIKPVFKFWTEFFDYIHYFFFFRSLIISSVILNNSELTEKLKRILEEKKIDREDYKKEMIHQYLAQRQLSQNQIQNFSLSQNDNIANEKEKNSIDNNSVKNDLLMDNGITIVGDQRIRIHHSNPNYKREMQQYSDHPLNQKPKRKWSCGPFQPHELPRWKVEEMRREGKLHD